MAAPFLSTLEQLESTKGFTEWLSKKQPGYASTTSEHVAFSDTSYFCFFLQSFAIDQPRVARRYDFSKVGKQTMKPRQDVIATWKLLKLSLFRVSFEIGLPWVYHEFTEIPGKPNLCWQGCRSLGGITLGRSSNTAGLEFLIAPGSSQVLKQSNKSRQLLKFQAFPFAKPPKCVSFLCLIFIIIVMPFPGCEAHEAAWQLGLLVFLI